MSGTTYEAIRAAQAAVLAELAPTLWQGLARFRPWQVQEGASFAEWCDGAVDPFRVFDIEHGFDLGEEHYLDTATSLEMHTMEVLVSYPATREWGGMLVEDLIEQDIHDIDRALGERGYHDYEAFASGLHKCALEGAPRIEERQAARVLHMTFLLDYDRSMD